MNLARRFQSYKNKTSLLVLAVATMVGLSAVVAMPKVAAAGDCSGNSVMTCGYSTPADFINKVKANNDGHGHTDLQGIYKAFDLQPNYYDTFASKSRPGVVNRDGTIVVDGKTVGTSAVTFGRWESYHSGPGLVTQGGLFGNAPTRSFSPGLQSLPVDAMFDSAGVPWVVIIRDCGNPVTFNRVKPTYSCDALNKTAVAGKPNTYTFTTKASAANNASIAKVVYDFGDGTPAVTQTSPSTPVTHTYSGAKSATYTAKVTVYVNVPGAQTVTVASANCTTQIVVAVPVYACLKIQQVAGVVDEFGSQTYNFMATASVKNATIKSYTFAFGDGQSTVVPTTATTATSSHKFKPGDYKTTVVIDGTTNAGSAFKTPVIAACTAPIHISVPVPGIKITKDVDGVPQKEVAVGQSFTYNVVVTNTGQATLTNVVVTDTPPKGVTLLKASVGTITANAWKYTIPSLKVGAANAFTVKFTGVAKAYLPDALVNKACVDSPEINPGKTTPDGCAIATVTLPTPMCPHNPELPASSPECKAPVCPYNPALPPESPECKKPVAPVCQYNAALPPDSPECKAPATTLVNTGPGSVAAITAGVAALSAFLYRQFVYKRKRTAAAAAMLGQHSLTDVEEPAESDQPDELVQSLSSKTNTPGAAQSDASEPKRIVVSDDDKE